MQYVSRKRMYLRTCGSLKSANLKKDWIRKSQIRKVSHLRNVHKCNQLFKSPNLRICYYRNLFVDHRPPLDLYFIDPHANFQPHSCHGDTVVSS
jgi:hypothetical protein